MADADHVVSDGVAAIATVAAMKLAGARQFRRRARKHEAISMQDPPSQAAATPNVPRTKQQRGEVTRQAILQAARKEFAGKGFDGGSMRSIARMVGLKIAHVQHHFSDKKSLWSQVLFEVVGQGVRELDRTFDRCRGDPPDEIICAMTRTLVNYAARHPDFVALMSHVRTSPTAEQSTAYQVELGSGIRRWIDLIADAQRLGRFVAGEPGLLFYQMMGAALRIFTAAADATAILGYSPHEPEVIDQHIRTCISIFMPGARHGLPAMQTLPALAAAVAAAAAEASRERNGPTVSSTVHAENLDDGADVTKSSRNGA